MAILNWLAWLLRVLWACRISVINVVASLLFFGFVVQAQNLMADLSSLGNAFAEFFFWAGVFGFTFLVWAFPVHYGARRTLDDPSWVLPRAVGTELGDECRDQVRAAAEDHAILLRWLPRLLGLMPFAALALGIYGALGALSGASGLDETELTRQQGLWLYGADALAALLFLIFVCLRRRMFRTYSGRLLHPVALVLTAAFFGLAYVWPIETSVILPRALLVPPLFGSLVLLLSWLQRLGHRTGFPFLAVLTIILACATGLNVPFNDLRTVTATGGDQRLSVADAVARWKTANNCNGSPCPRPVIVAIDGGASRASFTAATFVGAYLDHMHAPVSGEAVSPGRRIFAISGVSGGAYGAAVIQAALADSQGADPSANPPCHSAQTTWFGYGAWHAAGNAFDWRQCLQALTSGDYLSATIVGLGFRDFMAPPWQTIGLPAMPDRAALLEMTWERQYSATLRSGLPFFEGGDACADGSAPSGLCRHAAHPAAFFSAPHKSPVWIPMLLLNSTSAATGRRVVSSDLKSTKLDKTIKGSGALYAQAYDLREAMSAPCPDTPAPVQPTSQAVAKMLGAASEKGENERTLLLGVCGRTTRIDGPDVRLSTAALTSARFPLISPAGVFDMQASAYGDQVVDGGYFENSGLTTALEIFGALKDNGLDPVLVSISNDPVLGALTANELVECAAHDGAENAPQGGARGSLANCTGLPRRPATTPLVLRSDNTFLSRVFGILSRPFQTLVATGNGHGYEALGVAEALPDGTFHRLRVEVAPEFVRDPNLPLDADPACQKMIGKTISVAKVSMSWWLSASVQADLDIQRCSKTNQIVMRDLLAATRPASGR